MSKTAEQMNKKSRGDIPSYCYCGNCRNNGTSKCSSCEPGYVPSNWERKY